MTLRPFLSCPAVFIVLATVFIPPAFSEEKPKTQDVKVDDLKLSVPVTWKRKPPANKLRKGQFEIPAVKGDKKAVELVIYEFSGGGGGVGANIQRWIGQFQAKGRKAKVSKGVSPAGPYIFVDITGTYNMPVGPPIQRKSKPVENARMLAVILAVKDARKVYYLKAAGESKTVTANATALRTAFGANQKKEEPLKLPSDQ